MSKQLLHSCRADIIVVAINDRAYAVVTNPNDGRENATEGGGDDDDDDDDASSSSNVPVLRGMALELIPPSSPSNDDGERGERDENEKSGDEHVDDDVVA